MKLREFCRWILWLLKLSGALIGASFCLVVEVLLFFNLQEAWKDWEAGKSQLWELVRFAVFVALFHAPVLAGVFWFSRTAQRLWDNPDKGTGG